MTQNKSDTDALVLIHTMEANSNAIHQILTTQRVSQKSKLLLSRAKKANEAFLREFTKRSNDEADKEVDGMGSLLYEVVNKMAIVPEELVDQFSNDLTELCDAYNVAVTEYFENSE